jgi:two-component system, sensor histidine kinase and response regulator
VRRRLQQGLATGDAAELARVAHAFKSASLNVGARTLGETCRRLEHLGKSGSTIGAAALVAAVEAQYGQIVPLLREELGMAA